MKDLNTVNKMQIKKIFFKNGVKVFILKLGNQKKQQLLKRIFQLI